MRIFTRHSSGFLVARAVLIAAVPLLAIGCGGGGSDGTTTRRDAGADGPAPGTIVVPISGTVAPHPLEALLAGGGGASVDGGADGGAALPADFSQLTVAVHNPERVLADPNVAPLQRAPLDTTAPNCVGGACAWSFPAVDITGVVLGLLTVVEDQRPAGAHAWAKTGNGTGTAGFVQAVKASPRPITNREAFVISKALQNRIAAFVSVATNTPVTGDQLEANGYMLGSIVGPEGTPFSPVAGATVEVPPGALDRLSIYYPNDAFTATQAATGSTGTFVVVPKTPGMTNITQWTVKPPATETRTWGMHTGGTQAGSGLVLLFPAN
jgi:hypothetical protein